MMVFVRTGELRNAVLLPYPEEADSLATYMEFLNNDHEQIHVMIGQYQTDPRNGNSIRNFDQSSG